MMPLETQIHPSWTTIKRLLLGTRMGLRPVQWTCSKAAMGEDGLRLMREITDMSLQKAESRLELKTVAGVAAQLIGLAQGLVGSLLSPYPTAALAWSGFCTVVLVSLS